MYGMCIKSQKSLEWRVAGSLGIEIEKKEQTNQKKMHTKCSQQIQFIS